MTVANALSLELLEGAATVVCRRTGLVFGPSRMDAFEAAISNGIAAIPGTSPEAYLDRLDSDPSALDDLVAEITVGETYFFREPEQCALIRDQILPALLARGPHPFPLRVWSAGCATGEESYSLAMILREAGASEARIVGTDLSRAALARARRGHYSRWSLRGVADTVVESWFHKEGDRFVLRPSLREAVEFRYLNLAEDVYPSLASGIWGMDLIVCRNVLIYFDSDTVTRVARRLIDSLSIDGWLLLGSSDPSLANLVPCEVLITAAGLAYRRAGAAMDSAALPQAADPVPWESALRSAHIVEEEPVLAVLRDAPREALTPRDVPQAQALVSYRERSYERAADLAARGVTVDPDALPLWILWVRALANLGRLDEAGQACVAGLVRHQTSAELTYLHAVLLTEGFHHDAAARAARRALYLDRTLVVAHLALARSLISLGNGSGARRALRNASRLLAALAPDALVPGSDFEPAGRLAEMVRVQLTLLSEEAA